jgi:kynurenine formamidase
MTTIRPTTRSRWRADVIDLTRTLCDETIIALLGDSVAGDEFAEYRSVSVRADQNWEGANSRVGRVSLADHVGTHVDAPSHCLEDGVSIERIDLTRLIGDAVCVDLSRAGDYGYTAADFESATPAIEPDDIVLIYSGFRDCGPEDRVRQTFVTPDGARWLVERGVRAVGCEPGGLEHCWDGVYVQRWDDKDTPFPPPWPAHRILLANDVYIIEGLANLDRIRGRRVRFAALPLPIPGLSGSPVRAIAWTESDD